MNDLKFFIKQHRSIILFLIILLVAVCVFFHSFYIEQKIRKMKCEAVATVFFSNRETHYRGGSVWRSRGIYYVEGVGYTYTIEAVIPIGTKFKIYYLPSNPRKSVLANPHEFDNYPKYKKDP